MYRMLVRRCLNDDDDDDDSSLTQNRQTKEMKEDKKKGSKREGLQDALQTESDEKTNEKRS